MTRDELERHVLELWMETRIPLTLAHIQYATGGKRERIDNLLDELVLLGTLDVTASEEGEMVYTVPGAARPKSGPETFGEREGKRRKRKKSPPPEESGDVVDELASLRAASKALTIVDEAKKDLEKGTKDGRKSLAISGGVSLLGGPLGWLYAAPFKEAVPAAAAFVALAYILPSVLLMPILWVLLPTSAVAGVLYSWNYNKTGKRTPLFLKGKKDRDRKKSDEDDER